MTQLFTNNAKGLLNANLASGATSLTLQSGQGALFPSIGGNNFFLITLYAVVNGEEVSHEIIKVTNRVNDTFTIIKGQEGTLDRDWVVGTPVSLRITANSMQQVENAIAEKLPAVANYAALKALTNSDEKSIVFVESAATPLDGGEGIFILDSSDTTSSDNNGTILIDASNNRWKRVYSGEIKVQWFGALGNGVTDDTAAINAVLALGGKIKFAKNKQYLVSTLLAISIPTEIDLNGATISMVTAVQHPCFNIASSGVTIENGAINVTGSLMGGYGGALNCIYVTKYGNASKLMNFRFSNLTLSTNRNDAGAALGIHGNIANVLIENIIIPDNANCRNIIGCEWLGSQADGTGHPHNITIRNIKIGKLTYPSYGNAGVGYGVWLSAAFNVTIENLLMEQGHGLVMVTRGDHANTYAPADYKDLVGSGISVKNAVINSCYGYGIRVIGSYLSETLGNIDCDAAFTNIHIKGGKIDANTNFGASFEQCRNVKVKGLYVHGLISVGATTGINTSNVSLEDIIINDAELFAVSFSNGANKNSIRNGVFVGNNSLAGASANTAVILIGTATDCVVESCIFSKKDKLDETQKYAVYINGNALRTKLYNNHIYALAAGGIGFLNNITTTPNIDTMGENNTGETGITLVGGAPILSISENNKKSGKLSAMPTSGTWGVGDTIYHTAPAASGFIGWVCTAAGTPGTWKTFGAISA